MNMKANDSSIRETTIAAIREYRRALKRLMSVQHRASKPLRTYCDGCKRFSRGPVCPYC